MRSLLKNQYFLAFVLLSVTSVALAGDISIDGTCVDGTCPPPTGTSDAIQLGGSISPTAGSDNLVFGDTDTYSVSWTYSASFTSGTAISVDPIVTYTGSSPSVGNDVVTFDLYQSYYDSGPGTWDGLYTETIPLNMSGNVGAGSTVSGELFYYTDEDPTPQGLGLAGPFGPGSNTGTSSATLTGLDGDNLVAEFEFTYDFEAGTIPGAGASSTPEPAQALPLGLALLGIAGYRVAARRRAFQTS